MHYSGLFHTAILKTWQECFYTILYTIKVPALTYCMYGTRMGVCEEAAYQVMRCLPNCRIDWGLGSYQGFYLHVRFFSCK